MIEQNKLVLAIKELNSDFAVVVDGKVIEFTTGDILDLIQRLRGENERLKERNYWLESEHQYQCEKSYFEGVEKGGKDTAKEILAKAPNETNADEMFIFWIREYYGVVVE